MCLSKNTNKYRGFSQLLPLFFDVWGAKSRVNNWSTIGSISGPHFGSNFWSTCGPLVDPRPLFLFCFFEALFFY